MGLLETKVAIVTGAGRGIGRAVALAYAAEGAAVALAARSQAEIESVRREIEARGGRSTAVPTDVTRPEDVDALFARTRHELGEVELLVNNAAILEPLGMLWETELEDWRLLLDTNILGVVRCCRAALPGMISRRSGKIINVGSTAGWSDGWAAGNSEQAAYGVTKAAVMRLSYVLAQQVKPHGINVNCVGVSADTRMSHQAQSFQALTRGSAPPPAPDEKPTTQRVMPEENTGAFVFLASALSDHITGAYLEANALPDRIRLSLSARR